MTNWNQKELDALAGALETHLVTGHSHAPHDYLLIDARNRARGASQLPKADEKTLREIRSAVCQVCRQNSLYQCDVPDGWSPNCALLRNNA